MLTLNKKIVMLNQENSTNKKAVPKKYRHTVLKGKKVLINNSKVFSLEESGK